MHQFNQNTEKEISYNEPQNISQNKNQKNSNRNRKKMEKYSRVKLSIIFHPHRAREPSKPEKIKCFFFFLLENSLRRKTKSK